MWGPRIHVYLGPQNVTLLGSVFVDVLSYNQVLGWGLNPVAAVLIGRLGEDTGGAGGLCEDRAEDWSEAKERGGWLAT